MRRHLALFAALTALALAAACQAPAASPQTVPNRPHPVVAAGRIGSLGGQESQPQGQPAPHTVIVSVVPPQFSFDGRAAAAREAAANNDGAIDDDLIVDPEFFRQVAAPRGRLVERTFVSPTLARSLSYYAYLPPGYDERPGQRYPVVYFLHGIGGEKAEWLGYGLIQVLRDLWANADVAPFIAVFPQGDSNYWLNTADGERWGDYTAYDVTAEIDASFRTIPERNARLVSGLSMGGTGALQLGFNYADRFGGVFAHAPTMRTWDEALPIFGDLWHFSSIDPLTIARGGRVPPGLIVRMYAGDTDDWLERTQTLSDLLTAIDYPHELVVTEGAHDAYYWSANLEQYIRAYDAAFSQLLGSRYSPSG